MVIYWYLKRAVEILDVLPGGRRPLKKSNALVG